MPLSGLFRFIVQIFRQERCGSCEHWDEGGTSKDDDPMCCKLDQEHRHAVDWCERWERLLKEAK